MEHRKPKDTIIDGMSHMANELARYRRMVELAPEVNEMTVEEFDELLNKKCEEAHKRFESMDLGRLLLDGLVNALARDAKQNGPEAAGERLADLLKDI